MGYFDAIKDKPKDRPPVTTSATTGATPINGAHRDDLHPYARAIRDAWLQRLAGLTRPWVKGASWDNNCFVSSRKLIELANSPWSGYPLPTAHADYLAHAPHDNAWDQREKCWAQAVNATGGQALPEPEPNAPLPPVTILNIDDLDTVNDLTDDETHTLWHARPILTHLHDYARARRVSPWAVLGVALARVLTATPHHVVLPPIIGATASLNLFIGLVGASGSGKGAADAVADEALHVGHIDVHTTGSGEGIAHGYMRRERGQVIQHTHAVLFSIPEIDTLSALGNRQGATLMPELRRAWSGERLGFAYADPAKRLPVPAHTYRLCLVAGIQPHRAQTLLDDADGGTPQRFLWLPAADPHAPDTAPPCPTPRTWVAPDLSPASTIRNPRGEVVIDVCDTARTTIDTARLARLRGDGEALDGHGLLNRLKVAAGLALLESRLQVTDDDWDLAGLISRKSDSTRASVQAALSTAARQRNDARASTEATRAVVVSDAVADAAIKRVSRVVMRKLAGGHWTPRAQVRKAVAGRDRAYFEEALTRLTDAGQVVSEEGKQGVRIQLANSTAHE